MSQKKLEKSSAILAMPTEQIDFLRRNQRIAELVAKTVVGLAEAEQMLQEIHGILKDSSFFEPLLEDGSKEELEEFLKIVAERYTSIQLFSDLPANTQNTILDEFEKQGKNILRTEIRND